jgi:polysaccharide pyruvyl transferase WcaK-like protein
MKNLGDDYFLSILIDMFSTNNYTKIYITSIPQNLPKNKKVKLIGILKEKMILRWIEKWIRIFLYSLKSDILIFSAGSILTILPFKTVSMIIWLLKKLNPKIKILALGVSVGPFPSKKVQNNAIKLLNQFDSIVVRDKQSLKYLQKGFDNKVIYSRDLAFNYVDINNTPKKTIDPLCLGIALNDYRLLFGEEFIKDEDKRNDKILKIINKIINLKIIDKIVIFHTSSHKYYGDKRVSEYIFNYLKTKITCEIVIYNNSDINEFIGELSKCKVVLASRLHTGFFSLTQNTNVLQLAYADKISNFYEDLNIDTLKIHDAYNFDSETIFKDLIYLIKKEVQTNTIEVLNKESIKLQKDLKIFTKEWL